MSLPTSEVIAAAAGVIALVAGYLGNRMSDAKIRSQILEDMSKITKELREDNARLNACVDELEREVAAYKSRIEALEVERLELKRKVWALIAERDELKRRNHEQVADA